MLPFEMGGNDNDVELGESAFEYYDPTVRDLFQMGQPRDRESDQEMSSQYSPPYVAQRSATPHMQLPLSRFNTSGEMRASSKSPNRLSDPSRLSEFPSLDTIEQYESPQTERQQSDFTSIEMLERAPSPPLLQRQTSVLSSFPKDDPVSSPIVASSGPGFKSETLTDDSSEHQFGQRLAQIGLPDVFYNPSRDPRENVINLGNLHRMMLHAGQKELVEEVALIQERNFVDKEQIGRIRSSLKSYVSAIRDWEVMIEYSARAGTNLSLDPFIITSSKPLEADLMRNAHLIPPRSGRGVIEPVFPKAGEALNDPILPPIPRRTRAYPNRQEKVKNDELKAFWKRLYMATFGGVALVGPMLIMVLVKGLLCGLLTVSIATLLFGLTVSIFSNKCPETVMATVATYAGFLVVFLGTNL